jgi:hypothetical protein
MVSPYWLKRPTTLEEYKLLLEERLSYKDWLELTELCRRLKVSTASFPSDTLPPMDVYIREEDKDLLDA